MTENRGAVPMVAGVRRSALWALLLLPAGLAAGHTLGYWATGTSGWAPSLTTGHGYLGDLTTLAVPFTLAVVVRGFASGSRGEAVPVRLVSLAAMQVLLYVAVELAEHVAAGMSPAASLTEPSMLIGALAQVVVAGVLWLGLRLAHRAGEVVSAGRPRPHARRARARRWVIAAPTWAVPAVHTGSLSRRGPPRLLPLRSS